MSSTAILTHRPDTDSAHQAAVEKVISHMKANLVSWEIDLSLNALAYRGCYSKSHFISIFEEVTGTTPHHFLASLRIEKAKEFLLTTDATVTEISLEVGYSSFTTFSRTFSEYVGLSPSKFRTAPRMITPSQLLASVNDFIARNWAPASVEVLEGHVQTPPAVKGIIFVGSFTRGVPQGRPESGTVMLQPGNFRIRKPDRDSFHLLAALVPTPQIGRSNIHTIQSEWVASLRVQYADTSCVDLTLRPFRKTDPPLVVSLLGLLE